MTNTLSIQPEDEPRNFLGEAFKIHSGKSSMIPSRQHLYAVIEHCRTLASASLALPQPQPVQLITCQNCNGSGDDPREGDDPNNGSACEVCDGDGKFDYATIREYSLALSREKAMSQHLRRELLKVAGTKLLKMPAAAQQSDEQTIPKEVA